MLKISLRRVLLSALILLGGWGLGSSLFQINHSWQEYRRSTELAEWSHLAGQIMTMAQHLAFERGRTAVLLQGEHPATEAELAFIRERRDLADRAISDLRSRVSSVEGVNQAAFFGHWQAVLELRQQVDRDLALPRAQRDLGLVPHWVSQTTAVLNETGKFARELAQYYRQGEEPNRLNLLGFLTLRFRLLAGAEATTIAQGVARHAPLAQGDIYALYELRGQQEAVWLEIERYVSYLALPQMKKMADSIRNQQKLVLRPLQDSVLKSWSAKEAVTVKLQQLIAAAPPLLDGVSNLMTAAARESSRVAEAKMEMARWVLIGHVTWACSVLVVLLLAIYYVLAKVVRPLEAVDEKLRRIHVAEPAEALGRGNEIQRLDDTAQIMQAVFEEKSRLENELRDLAFNDPLTGLPNRRLMQDRLQRSILHALRSHNCIALLFIDLDRFKPINDEYGHEVGDWLLRMLAERLVACIRISDTAARLGGDEFIVILPDLAHPDDALPIGQQVLDAIVEPFATESGQWLEMSASIGIAIYPQDADNEADLLRLADEAMFRAKNAGRNRIMMAS